MQTRQLITGIALALAALLLYKWAISFIFPPLPPAATQPAESTTETTAVATQPTTTTSPATAPIAETAPSRPREYAFVAGTSDEPIDIGGGPQDHLGLTLTPRGAGVVSMRITQLDDKGRFRYRAKASSDEPYPILEPLDAGSPATSFLTEEIRVQELNQSWRLDELLWQTAEASEHRVVFTTTLRARDNDEPLLNLKKTYELQEAAPLVHFGLTIENPGDRTLTVLVRQDGPTGIRRESPMYEMRRLLTAQHVGDTVKTAKAVQRAELQKAAARGDTVKLFPGSGEDVRFAWAALANRFFAVFMRPLPELSTQPDFVQGVRGTVARPDSDAKLGDMVARLASGSLKIDAGQQLEQVFEIHAGPKDPEVLAAVDPAFVDTSKINYGLAHAADSRCCTFEPLPQIMVGLLHGIHWLVRNYGIAIIILVLIVRTCLHPLTVYQQKQMYRMQDAMSRLQPKLQALKERHANDKVRQNQEMMKLYAEEGVNPMASIVGMLPLFLQMPILVALWTGLNTDIQLRHAPLDGFWIRDLAAPDALVPFEPPLDIPILGQLPVLGWMFSGITAFNLLPILMGISMWLQQKYMPKPGMQAKLEAAKKQPPKERKPGQLSPEDQLRQQQMIGYMMTFMFPLMFYYMPSGLNLYWMATNVFGIAESLVIRKQLREEKERREREGPPPPTRKKPGFISRTLKHMAERAEEIQRRADELSKQGPKRQDRDQRKP